MAAPRKYPDELRERATRMAVEARQDPATRAGALARIAKQLGINPETLRNWVTQAEIDGGVRPGTTTDDARRIAELERENRELRRANEILKTASAFFGAGGARPPTEVVVEFIDEHKERFGVEPVCAALKDAGVQIAPSTYYAHRSRPPSARSQTDAATTAVIERVHAENFGVYGARKVHAELRRQGHRVARCTVERLMRRRGLRGISRAKGPRTTVPGAGPDTRPDLVDRAFTATGPDQLWVADITYCRTFSGWVYAAFVIDVFSRRVVGWQLSKSLRTDLALDALEMGIWTRRRAGRDVGGLIHHSDKGVQYVAVRYTQRLAEAGAVASVGSTGDSYDNALAEAFNSLFKAELVRNKGPWKSIDDLEIAVAEYIDWFNHRRLHGELGLVPPAEHEDTFYRHNPAAATVAASVSSLH
ncbi:IS3 family transposase [Blastococcus sp. MG754426]|uniref:IS3 family transposase n=1 Tax=unclassified Blastococcus TaxID=2619396 RepID=UPI0035AB75FF|nr:IS3 family transposase [Blastococcus sp. MG754426]MCF6514506.1 IS3 family transposase [Blastococcus sp. MG754427]MCF6737717.1 IS3 family transposase [Blastococcus sp. KM273129]